MHQRRDFHAQLVLCRDVQVRLVLLDALYNLARLECNAEAVLKAGVRGVLKHEASVSQLLAPPQPLVLWSIDDLPEGGVELDPAVHSAVEVLDTRPEPFRSRRGPGTVPVGNGRDRAVRRGALGRRDRLDLVRPEALPRLCFTAVILRLAEWGMNRLSAKAKCDCISLSLALSLSRCLVLARLLVHTHIVQ